MIKCILIISALWFVIELFSNVGDMLYLLKTNAKLHAGEHILDRLIHVRDLCYKAGVCVDSHYFKYPDRNYTGISNYIVQAIGEYKHRALRCLNPVYWVKCLFFLPKNIIGYFGGNSESILAKTINGVYWLIGITVQLYPTETKNIIERLFSFLQ